MVNNIELISSILVFDSSDDFYHLQIIKRKKENREIGSNSLVIKTYYITSVPHLHSLMKEIITLCEIHNARACINLNVRSFEKAAFHTLKKVSDIIMNRDYKSVRSAFDSVCGEYSSGRNKLWIVDIDNDDLDFSYKLRKNIEMCNPVGEKVILDIPTKNGHHFICKPFDLRGFTFNDIDIHKNNPTILYVP